jgi:SEC-C motif-containing protein
LKPPADRCPCGRTDARGRVLAMGDCCGRYLAGESAPDPESLMRSRYTAFVRGDETYLLATWHPSTRPAQAGAEGGPRWLGLSVRAVRVLDLARAEVEFVARYRPVGQAGIAGQAVRHEERSRFVLESGRWYYLEPSLS